MRSSFRGANRAARLNVETLEDRLTPAVAYALNAALGGGTLLAFDTANPSITTPITISGVNGSETLVGIDFRPQNGLLYGLGVNDAADTATLYVISTRTGQATIVGDPTIAVPAAGQIAFAATNLPASGYGFDFNPAVDRIRVTTGSGLNFRIDPNTGQEVGAAPDTAISGVLAGVTGAGYTNNQPNNGNVTTLYTLDDVSDSLYIQGLGANPNGGVETLVAALTLNGAPLLFDANNGFDISAGVNAPASNTAVTAGFGFAVLTVGSVARLYTVNLVSGAATFLGNVGSGAAVQGFAVQSDLGAFPAIGMNAVGPAGLGTVTLTRFNTTTPGTATAVAVTGINGSETLAGIDFRPQTGQLYGLGVNPTTGNATLYLLDPQTGAATIVGAVGSVDIVAALPDPATAGYGFDFNPTVDRIRVTTSTGLDFRVIPNTGAVAATDPVINGGATGVSAAAYTNSFGQPLTGGVTTLYTIDATTGMLFIQNPPNNGTETLGKTITLNGAPLAFTSVNGFDIPAGVRVAANNVVASGFGYASLMVGGVNSLYRIDLATGAATFFGGISGNLALSGLALGDAPAGAIGFQTGAVTVAETGKSVSVVVTRTTGTGPATATVTIVGGTAMAGLDYTGGSPYTVTFVEGQTTAVLSIPILNDTLVEGNETIVLLITAAPGAAISGQTATTITITDDDPRLNFLIGTGAGVPIVQGFNVDGSQRFNIMPYGPGATGGVRVAMGDLTGDGVADIITVPGTGPAIVMAFDGLTGASLGSFLALAGNNGGASLAVGDLNGDGRADVIAGMARFGTLVAGFSGANLSSLGSFTAFAGSSAGLSLAVADLNNDGLLDIIVGTASGSSVVGAFSGKDLSSLGSFAVFNGAAVGVNVTAPDLNGDGRPDILVGSVFGIAQLSGYDGTNLAPFGTLLPFGALNGGIFVG